MFFAAVGDFIVVVVVVVVVVAIIVVTVVALLSVLLLLLLRCCCRFAQFCHALLSAFLRLKSVSLGIVTVFGLPPQFFHSKLLASFCTRL